MSHAKFQYASALTFLIFAAAVSVSRGADDGLRFVGRSSCGTATCHGGVVGIGPAWHSSSSVWEANDPHVRAGEVLLGKLSQQIVRALEPGAVESETAFHKTLQTRCTSCHAPQATSAPLPGSTATRHKLLHSSLLAGVSCEACHGPASRWENAHTRRDWVELERFGAATGMLDTESLLARTDNCARCHVGSRTADGQIRDMNHDMIAAGHPALYFDMVRYQSRLPPHWDDTASDGPTEPRSQLAERLEGLRTRVLWAAIKLSVERHAASSNVPQPELSEYDCSACHHQLHIDSSRQQRSFSGTALWQPWYTAGRELAAPRTDLRLDQPQMEALLKSLSEPVRQRSVTQALDPNSLDQRRGGR